MSGKTSLMPYMHMVDILGKDISDEEIEKSLPANAVGIKKCWNKIYDKECNLISHQRGFTYFLDDSGE